MDKRYIMLHLYFMHAVEQLQEDIYLQLDNAKINMTRGTMRLFLNKSGTATAVQNVFFEPKVR